MPHLRPGDHDAVLNGTRIHYSARCVQVTALCGYTGGVLWGESVPLVPRGPFQ
jgi:hypothetical protein